jgi:hypothetical protein
MKRVCLAVVFLLSISALVSGQPGQPLRVEIPVRTGTNPFNYISFGENGICMFYPTSNDVGKDSVSWSFVMLDKNLKEQWRKLIPMHEDVNYLKGFSRNNVMYLLFHDTQRNKDGNIHVLFIYPSKQIITEHRSSIPDKAEVADFEIWNEYALVGYNQRKGKPGLMGFSLVTGEKRNFDFTVSDDALLLDISADTVYKDIYAVYKIQPNSSRNMLMVNIYDGSSALRRTVSFNNAQEKRILNSAQIVVTGNRKGFVAGTFGPGSRNRRNYDYYNDYYNYYYYNNFYRRSTYDANQDNTPVSDGYYTASLNQSDTGQMKYYSFIDFSNTIKYINDPEALRTKKKADRSNKPESADVSASDRNYSLDYRLLVHPLVSSNGYYIFLSEAYSPEYHTMTQMVYDYYGRAIPSSYSVFDGFRYSNAFVSAFDSSGTMLWNNGIEMRDILTTYLNRKVNFYNDSSSIILFYNANSKIAFKIIQGSTVLENTNFTPIAPKKASDQLISEYLGSIEPWYGDYFLASGYESIRSNNMEDNKRNVFYLSKLAIR